MSRDIVGYRNPVATHRCVVERRDTTGYMPRHGLFAGEWRAICLHCQWSGAWTYREMATDAGGCHDAWAAVDPGPGGSQPIAGETLMALAIRLAEDAARLRERTRCLAAGHLTDRHGRPECSCAARAAHDAGVLVRHRHDTGDVPVGRVEQLAAEVAEAFDAHTAVR